jgi:sugar lactone lactonase YvrE
VGEDFGINTAADSRGVALADYDGDGGLDLFVAIQDGADQLFRNVEAEGNWLTIVPRGTSSSSDAIGTRIRIEYDRTRSAIREIAGGTSFLSQDALSASFGIGEAESVDIMEIRWPSGILQRFSREDIGINKMLTVLEEQPLPPVDLLVTTSTNVLVANGSALTELSVTLLNSGGEISLVSDREISFTLDIGGGQLITSGPRVTDGFATAIFTAGLIPGTISLTIAVTGLPSERILLELIPPLVASDTFIETIAGTTTPGFDGDGDLATNARLNLPRAVVADAAGNVYVADSANNRIRRISPADSIVMTIAGSGATGIGDVIEGPATSADIGDPRGLTILPNGDLIVSETGGQKVRRINLTTGITTAFAGSGFSGFGGDGGPASDANLTGPRGITSDSLGQVYIADLFNNSVRSVTDGIINTVAGDPLDFFAFEDGVPATESRLDFPNGVAVDNEGNLYIAETNTNRVRKVDVAGIISTFAGDGTRGSSGDGGPAAFARLNAPLDVAYDPAGRLLVSDSGNNKIRSIDLQSGVIQTIAGSGTSGANGNHGTALDFNLNGPAGIALAPDRSILIADADNNRVLKLTVLFQNADPPVEPPPIQAGGGNGTPDFNDDGIVDFLDFLPFATSFGTMNDTFDLDDDGWVGFSDFITFAEAFGKPTTSNPAYSDAPPIWLRR